MNRALIFGVGNELRKDDAAGLEVARRIGERNFPGVSVVESTGDLSNYVNDMGDFEILFIVDSVLSEGAPGTIHRIDFSDPDVEFILTSNISTHWLGIMETLQLARNIGKLPDKIMIYGIEGAEFAHGEGISPQVLKAIETAVDEITAIF